MKEPKDCKSMEEVRDSLDVIDLELATLIAKRFTYIHRAAEIKYLAGLPPRTHRVQGVVDIVRNHAAKFNLDPDLFENIWRLIIEHGITIETKLMGLEKDTDIVIQNKS